MSERFLHLQTPGPFSVSDVITSFSGREQLSRPFEFHLEVQSGNLLIKPEDAIGIAICIQLDGGEGKSPRYFHGYISHISLGESAEGTREGKMLSYRSYRVRIVPWLWFLSRAARSFIFLPEKEKKNIAEVLKEVKTRVDDTMHVKAEWDDKTDGFLDACEVEHCVQYRETDFNFFSRILEQYGITYYFEHTKDKHQLVMVNIKHEYLFALEKEVEFPVTTGGQGQADHITSWEHNYEFVTGKYVLNDYNFETPMENLITDEPPIPSGISQKHVDKYEFYDAPGEYSEKGRGDVYATYRQREEQSRFNTVNASSTCRSFTSGRCFTLKKHPSCTDEEKKDYLITSISHSAAQPGPFSGEGSISYSNRFEAMSKKIHYQPPRLTPKPLVSGIQTATVAGGKEDEIHTDKYGRIKVHFHWDRISRDKRFNEGEKLFCWLRVAMPMAGKGWGMFSIPRVGQEVVVDFIDGDPDRPLVIGSVYNEQQMPHYNPEQHPTRSYIKTNSSKGGAGFNELMFEDLKDQERVFIHAQKDMDIRALNNATYHIHANHHEVIGSEKTKSDSGDFNQQVWRDKQITVKRDQAEHVMGNYQLLVGKGEGDAGRMDIVIDKQEVKKVGLGGSHISIEGPSCNKVGGDYGLNVGGDVHLKAGGAVQIEAGAAGEVHIKAMNIILEATVQMSFKVGPNFIDIGPAGISIQGVMTNINSGGAPASGQPCQPETPEVAKPAEPAAPSEAWNSATGNKSRP